jgi:ABC-2 type transport system ATP-binding protein
MAAIEVTQVSKRYGSKDALHKVSFKVEEGTFFGCFGPNGAGKTTLLRLLTGQTASSEGEAKVLGMDCFAQRMEVKAAVGIVPEVESPPSYLTPYEFLYFVGRLRGLRDVDERIEHWLDFFDLQDARGTLVKDLSKGMRQKLLLSAAFIHEPRLLFLDEPFINLDPIYQRKVREYLLSLREEGRTIFLCSHILEIAQRLCQEVIVLDRGKVVANHAIIEGGESLEDIFLRSVA